VQEGEILTCQDRADEGVPRPQGDDPQYAPSGPLLGQPEADTLHRAPATTAEGILKRDPGFAASANVAALCYARDEDRSHHREALIAAGLPG
jgi:hypothetical protein